jgi:hypothetical protein
VRISHDLSFGDFHLSGHRDLVRRFHARRTPSGELAGAKARHDCELECAEVDRTRYHRRLPF